MRIPLTRARVGWDAIIGMVPVVGDIAGLGLSMLVITRGVLLGARRWTVARMVLIAAVDAAVGLIPFVGGLFDFVYKANERNLRTIERHRAEGTGIESESRRVVLVSLVLLATMGTLAVLGLVALVVWLARQF
jgi:hypothetical protein